MNMNARDTQHRLAKATVSIIGLGGVGASAALALAAARIGTLRCFDPLSVSATDPYLCPAYSPEDLGTPRAEVVRRKIELLDPAAGIDARMDALDSDETVVSAINGSDFVLCCADPGAGNTIYKVNRACLQTGTSWTSCTVSGFEGVLGPTVHPRQTPCYLCYKMRAVSCAENPEDEFAFQRFLDRRKHEDSGRRENLVFGVGVIANLAGLEVMKALTEFHPPSSEGRIVVIDFLDVSCKKHLVLRKPWCPACGVAASNSGAR
jgi:adenylyltransferase/sulfurtransferase